MSMKTKRSVKIGLLSLFISISLLLSCMTVVRAFENDISIFVNGITIETDVPPQIENDRVLVPMRAIFETFGAQIEWNDEIKTVYAEKDKTEITVKIGDKKIIVNGEEKEIDTAAVIYGSRTLVPLRAISESFGYKCIWDEKQRSVRVLSFELPQLSETEYDKEVFTKIGSTEYSVSVANAYADMLSDGEKLSDETLKKKLLNISAYIEYCDKYGIELSQNEKDYNDYMLYRFINSDDHETYLEKVKTSDIAVRTTLYQSELVTKAAESAYKDAESVSDDMLLCFAKENYICAKHILLPSAEIAQLVYTKLQDGETFEELLKSYNFDTYQPEQGYVFTKGTMTEAFEKAAFALKDNEISEIVESPFGFHIIKKYPITNVSDDVFLNEQMKNEILQKYLESIFNKKMADIKNTLSIK